ncbi:hypothetical protein, partial [Burkholderia vietnamiensis]|uniref:hypothetical protein n=1 Tax=Burkholderia vietnamiensis TaxID=60552 RepID=UPI001E4F5205
ERANLNLDVTSQFAVSESDFVHGVFLVFPRKFSQEKLDAFAFLEAQPVLADKNRIFTNVPRDIAERTSRDVSLSASFPSVFPCG